jgi:hypothetical protein
MVTNCPDCGQAVAEGSAFCCLCGGRVRTETRPAPGQPEVSADVRPLLARANLLRVRGQWEAAAEQCAEVLRLDPRNAAAHSLLGEIYDNQGYLDRAIRWYSEALELDPANVADRAKLARATELHESRRRPPSGASPLRFSWLRVAGVAGGVICGGLILLAVLFAGDRPIPEGTVPVAPVIARPPERAPAAAKWLTSREREVGSSVAATTIRPPMELATFRIDPRDQTVHTGIVLDLAAYADDRAPSDVRTRLLHDGYRLAHQIVQEYPLARRVELSVAVKTGRPADAPEFSYWFVGSLLSSALVARPEIVTAGDLQRIYINVWWNQQVTP